MSCLPLASKRNYREIGVACKLSGEYSPGPHQDQMEQDRTSEHACKL